jgi:hypothetical protein
MRNADQKRGHLAFRTSSLAGPCDYIVDKPHFDRRMKSQRATLATLLPITVWGSSCFSEETVS